MKSAAILTVILTSLLVFPQAQAQDGAPAETLGEEERAREDYLFQFANYADAHIAYETAKEAYIKFGTIASQQEAVQATKNILSLRAEVLRTYLQLIKIRLNSLGALDSALRSSQFGKIEATQAFISTHEQNIQRTASVSEVNAESARLEREAKATYELSYETLAYILIGEIQELEARTRTLLEDTIRNAPEGNQAVEQGTSEVRRKLTTVRLHVDRANEEIRSFTSGRQIEVPDEYKAAQREVTQAKTVLREAVQLIREIASNL